MLFLKYLSTPASSILVFPGVCPLFCPPEHSPIPNIQAQDECLAHTRKAFPNMAKTVVEAATRVVQDLPSQLEEADKAMKRANELRKVSKLTGSPSNT